MKKFLFIVKESETKVLKLFIECKTKKGAIKYFIAKRLAIDYFCGTEDLNALLRECEGLLLICRIREGEHKIRVAADMLLSSLGFTIKDEYANTCLDLLSGEMLENEIF